jgi:hypothetical protein
MRQIEFICKAFTVIPGERGQVWSLSIKGIILKWVLKTRMTKYKLDSDILVFDRRVVESKHNYV